MKCAECNLWGADYYGDIPYCHANPHWPAPCEYDDYEEEEEDFFNENDPYVVTDPMAFY